MTDEGYIRNSFVSHLQAYTEEQEQNLRKRMEMASTLEEKQTIVSELEKRVERMENVSLKFSSSIWGLDTIHTRASLHSTIVYIRKSHKLWLGRTYIVCASLLMATDSHTNYLL